MNTILFSQCEWDKKRKVLRLSTEYGLTTYPFFFVQSDRTGKMIKFISLSENDEDFDEDGWDGEISMYKPVEDCGVHRFVVYNQY